MARKKTAEELREEIKAKRKLEDEKIRKLETAEDQRVGKLIRVIAKKNNISVEDLVDKLSQICPQAELVSSNDKQDND